eukprot:12861412-Ditylum_brightwellii.AAC.1
MTQDAVGNPTPHRLANLFIEAINDMVPRQDFSYCGAVQLHQILHFSSQEIQPNVFEQWNPTLQQPLQRNLRMGFSTTTLSTHGGNTNNVTEWQAVMNLRAFGAEDLVVGIEQGFQTKNGTFNTEMYTMRSIERPSDWPKECRDRAFADGLDPKYCVCA